MTYYEQWKALSSRIRGLMKAGQLYADFLKIKSSDAHGIADYLREQSESVLSELRSFKDQFQQSLPPIAIIAIDRFEEKARILSDKTSANSTQTAITQAALVKLVAFETEMSFVFADAKESIRARSERAFLHLNRSIVVDSAFQEKWQTAFIKGEVECEKLGAVHLLLHGIYAFKTDTEGARTDLVFQEPVGGLINELSFVDGLVLTEWKKMHSKDGKRPTKANVDNLFEEGRKQAKRYALGALAGNELTDYRFVVVVSEKQVESPDDHKEGSITYRHINIAVKPDTPSKAKD